MKNAEVRYEFMKYFIEKEYSGYNCKANDFLLNDNKVVLADESDEDFYGMMCFQNAVVVKAKKDIYEWSKKFVSRHIGFRCFDFPQIAALCKELLKFNFSMQGGQGFLPDMKIKRITPETGFTLKIFNKSNVLNILNYIEKAEWHMCHPSEKSALVVAAFDKNKIVGLSSADKDTDLLYSIDVEVLPKYQQKGVAIALTTEITNSLLKQNIIPFATGAWSNNASRATLCRCGYYPAWSGAGSCNDNWVLKILNE